MNRIVFNFEEFDTFVEDITTMRRFEWRELGWKRQVKFLLLVLLPIVLWILPVDHFDQGQSISVFAFFGVEKYVHSTGMTRSIMHLLHFDIEGAIHYNKLSFFVLPLLLLIWSKQVLLQLNIRILKGF